MILQAVEIINIISVPLFIFKEELPMCYCIVLLCLIRYVCGSEDTESLKINA